MQTFIFGLLLACVSGITVVAFKHPNGFARLFPFLLGTATIVFVGVTIWHVAVETTWKNLVVYIGQETLSDAETTKRRLSMSYMLAVIWYLGVIAFLWVNLKLPAFLQNTDVSDAQDDNDVSH